MLLRRQLLKSISIILANGLFQQNVLAVDMKMQKHCFFPDEHHPHQRTWMAFVANEKIWSKKQIPQVKKDLALIANTLAQYEPVSILVNTKDINEAKAMLNLDTSKFSMQIYECEIDDLWLRDTGPCFVRHRSGKKFAIDFNFNGWGNKQIHSKDKYVAEFIAKVTKTPLYKSRLVLEGGGFEVDGAGNALMTKSCILNENRNPGWAQADVETELKHLLGLKKIIWLEGVEGQDITDAHIDFYARFIKPAEVLVSRENYRASFDYQLTRENIKKLEQSVDAQNRPLKLNIIDTPNKINQRFGVRDFAAGYIGYYVCNGAVIVQKFGDKKADDAALAVLERAFPQRVIHQIRVDGIASGGGSIHCVTQQEPLI